METSITVIWILTNLIMLAGGYYLGVVSEKEKAVKVVQKVIEGCAMYLAINDLKVKESKKEKHAKHAGRI